MDNTLRVKINLKGITTVERKEPDAVKALLRYEEYDTPELVILGVPFGGPVSGRDIDGEAFTVDTDIWLKVGDERPVTYCHGYGPDSPDACQERPVVMGTAVYTGADERGHWFRARMDSREPLARRVLEMMQTMTPVRASSGAVGHLVRMDELKSGIIKVWPVGELAIFDTNEWRLPANDFAVVNAKAEIREAAAEAGNSAEAEWKAERQNQIRQSILKEVIRNHGRNQRK